MGAYMGALRRQALPLFPRPRRAGHLGDDVRQLRVPVRHLRQDRSTRSSTTR
ncbi:MAG: hypothetical protein MZV64_63160 [Ignavibacteriales bacterium]|nr:hypothetical protein [Ignavibacteriales bacterium]